MPRTARRVAPLKAAQATPIRPPAAILAGDIGGTHARFALYPPDAPGNEIIDEPLRLDLKSRDYPDVASALSAALARSGIPDPDVLDVVLALAGPVRGRRVALTNLPWTVDAEALRKHLDLRQVTLVNDLEAAARSLAEQPPGDAAVLRPGHVTGGRTVVISVGTGLGTAYWTRHDGKLCIDAAEAGHAGFAPAEPWQTDFLCMLQRHFGGRVSWERVLSGSGLAWLEAFVRGGEPLPPAEVSHRAASGDTPALMAVQRFSALLGSFAGDLVLAGPAMGGVWLAGGVLAGLGPLFDTQAFFSAFDAKGRLAKAMGAVPVLRTDDGNLGVRGAWFAARAAYHGHRRDLWASA